MEKERSFLPESISRETERTPGHAPLDPERMDTTNFVVAYHDGILYDSSPLVGAATAPPAAVGSRDCIRHPQWDHQDRQQTMTVSIQPCNSYSNFYDAVSDARPSTAAAAAAAAALLHHHSTTSGRLDDLLRRGDRKRDVLLGYSLLIVTSLATAVMNAAITIFGMGVGVGLILGESMRDFPAMSSSSTTTLTASSTTTSATNSSSTDNDDEGHDVQVYPASPSCRATVQRISTRRTRDSAVPNPQQRHSLSTMPAQ